VANERIIGRQADRNLESSTFVYGARVKRISLKGIMKKQFNSDIPLRSRNHAFPLKHRILGGTESDPS
jgi:hypothetical protein